MPDGESVQGVGLGEAGEAPRLLGEPTGPAAHRPAKDAHRFGETGRDGVHGSGVAEPFDLLEDRREPLGPVRQEVLNGSASLA
ncbi:hypothetical protein LV779_29960 [Streptomyces thinghirensis]|nr:hypothetical protein [Streptomyces thinghirensis]